MIGMDQGATADKPGYVDPSYRETMTDRDLLLALHSRMDAVEALAAQAAEAVSGFASGGLGSLIGLG